MLGLFSLISNSGYQWVHGQSKHASGDLGASLVIALVRSFTIHHHPWGIDAGGHHHFDLAEDGQSTTHDTTLHIICGRPTADNDIPHRSYPTRFLASTSSFLWSSRITPDATQDLKTKLIIQSR